MRFIHAADIHLDSPMHGLSAYPEAPAARLRSATRDAFVALIDLAIAERIDFLVIAGDLYDGNWKDFNTGIFFVRQMGRLHAAGIPVFLLFGNHDAESEMTRRLLMPDNVRCFPSTRADTFMLPDLRVALHGRSFREAATTENLVLGYPPAVPGWCNIGVLHTALEGYAEHARYAPCSRAELEARGYDYWALGHVHEHQVWHGRTVIAFPGNLQGRSVRETGARGALLVTAEEGRIHGVERLIVDVLRWEQLEVDLSAAASLDDVVRHTGLGLERLLDGAHHALPIALRIRLHGVTAAHGALFGADPAELRAGIVGQAEQLAPERLWIEKIRIETRPAVGREAIAARHDALAELQRLLGEAGQDSAFLASLQQELLPLLGRLPPEVLHALPELEAIREGRLQDLLDRTLPGLVSHLAEGL